MKNYVAPGDVIPVTAPGAVSSGDLVTIGNLCGVAVHDAANGAALEICRTGVYDLPCVSGDDIGVGALLYDNGSGVLTLTATSNEYVGIAVAAAGTGVTTVRAVLTGAGRTGA